MGKEKKKRNLLVLVDGVTQVSAYLFVEDCFDVM